MKYYFLFAICLSALSSYGQKVVRDEVDEFTGHSVLKTNYNAIVSDMKFQAQIAGSKVDSVRFIEVALSIGVNSYFTVNKGDEFMIKTQDGTIIKLSAMKTDIASRGGLKHGKFAGSNAVGVNVSYAITASDYETLKAQNIEKIRFYTSDGYVEKELSEKSQTVFKKTLDLLM